MQSEMPNMISAPPFEHLRNSKTLAVWTLLFWTLFVLSVVLGQMARDELDYLVIGWWIASASGIAAGVLGVRANRAWLKWAVLAALVLVVVSAFYWSAVVEKLMYQDTRATIGVVLHRIWQMTAGGLQAGLRDGMAHWAFATVYRETLMPLLQIAALVAVGFARLTTSSRIQGGS